MAKKETDETPATEDLSEDDLKLLQEEGIEVTDEDLHAESEDETGDDPEKAAQADEEAPEDAEKPSGDEEPSEPAKAAQGTPDGFVPVKTLTEMRNERNQYRDTLAQIASKLAEQRAAKVEPEVKDEGPKRPDPREDPIDFMVQLGERLDAMQNASSEREQQTQEQNQQAEQWRNFYSAMDAEYARAIETDPTVKDAFSHAEQAYMRQMEVMGIPVHEMQQNRQQYLQTFAVNWAQLSRKTGISLGDYVKEVAQSVGWQAKPAGQKEPDAKEKIERQRAAMNASKTLSKAGSSGKAEIDLKDLANLSGEDLENLLGKDDELFARLTGSAR